MKTRSGFVSNSSSTSFIVAVPRTAKVCKCCNRSDAWMLEAVCKYLSTLTEARNQMWTMTSQESVLIYFKKELEDLIASKTYAENQLAIIEEIEKEPKIFENYEKLKRQLERYRRKISLPDEAQFGEYVSSPEQELSNRKAEIKKHLNEYDNKVKDIKSLIAKMKKYHAKDYQVYAFTIDNWANAAERNLKKMIQDNIIEVIRTVVT